MTGRDRLPEDWNGNVGRAVGKKEKIKTLNAYLDPLQQIDTVLPYVQLKRCKY
ncbi:hypothetical protein [Pelobium manganitolerans]|uniref:hypothetical protein n=1 Tax=Pelobium manganitolerans TaxID=1842495 RepID=UPI001C7D5FAD|nr:hypothetical protein [Pelobium manganitolerans]